MAQAKMPIRRLTRTIASLEVGESGWTTPWAIVVDDSHKCWLNLAYSCYEAPGGTVELEVTRVSSKGYVAGLSPDSDYTWHVGGSCSGANYVALQGLDGV